MIVTLTIAAIIGLMVFGTITPSLNQAVINPFAAELINIVPTIVFGIMLCFAMLFIFSFVLKR